MEETNEKTNEETNEETNKEINNEITMIEKMKKYLKDVEYGFELYKKELEGYGIVDELEELLQSYIEANYQMIHDTLLNENYDEYNEWIEKHIK